MKEEMIISVRSFEQKKKCEEAYRYSKCLEKPERPYVMHTLLGIVCNDLKQHGKDSKDEWDILFDSYRQYLEKNYQDEWFLLPWQKGSTINLDIELIRRFVSWFLSLSAEIVETLVKVCYPYDGITLFQVVSMIYKRHGVFHAAILHSGKAKKSKLGKTTLTNIDYDLASMIAKQALEERYPGIIICNIYLKTDADLDGEVGCFFTVNKSKKSQYFCNTYDGFYENGVWNQSKFEEEILLAIKREEKKDCSFCPYGEICQSVSIQEEIEKERIGIDDSKEECVYYTEKQLEGIKSEGPTLICAGPGSGKTATLVGKIRYLTTEKKVPPPLILMLSFTNESVETMKKRVHTFCPEYNAPTITTIHALAYNILSDHRKMLHLKKNEILTDNALKEIIYHQLSFISKLDHINLHKSLTGKYGLLEILCRYYKSLMEGGEDEFFQDGKHADCGEDFLSFAKDVNQIIKERAFITFDEQITLCLKLLKENPEILNTYRQIYPYILVDEFQDVNKEQAEFIYLLAAPRNNLTVVGDDDQSIYSWRGGDRNILLSFPERFQVKPIVLDKNFRSTGGIVTASEKIISLKNAKRIPKQVFSEHDFGEKPCFIQSTDTNTVEKVIESLCCDGYQYKDIVLLARTNAELNSFKESLHVPCVLGKNYVTSNPLFRFLYELITFYRVGNMHSYIMLMMLYGFKDHVLSHAGTCSLEKETFLNPLNPEIQIKITQFENLLSSLKEVYELANTMEESAVFFLQAYYAVLGISSDSAFVSAMDNLLLLYQIKDLDSLYHRMKALLEFGDETRMNINHHEDAVLLLTLHEAKGMEFPACIVIDDGKTNYAEDAEGLNLLYVGLTRPKQKCFFLSKRSLPFFGDDIFNRIAM